MGIWTPDESYGFWSVHVNPEGTWLYFTSQGGGSAVYLTTSINWLQNSWHQIVVTYGATGTAIYVDGQLATSGAAMTTYPSATVRAAHGISIGSDLYGTQKALGDFEELETFNFVKSASTIFAEHTDFDQDGLTLAQELQLGLDPYNADTGGTGVLDGQKDLDNDGFSNAYELNVTGTDPLQAFSVSTLIKDGPYLRLAQAYDPQAGQSAPVTSQTTLRLVSTNGGATQFLIENPMPNTAYAIYYRPDLNSWTWFQRVATGNPGQTNFSVPTPPGSQSYWVALVDADSDQDGLPDGYEMFFLEGKTVIGRNDAATDSDGDDLTNLQEYQFGTHPNRWDSDADGLSDGSEINVVGTDPKNRYSNGAMVNGMPVLDGDADPDGDGILHKDEVFYLTNPFVYDPPFPTFSVAVTSGPASESGASGVFTITRAGDTTRAKTVYISLTGGARAGRDYVALTNEVVFSVGVASMSLTIQPINDTDYEGTETVTLSIDPDISYLLGAVTSATLDILDNDLPGVSVVATKPLAAEAGLVAGEFEFRRTGSTGSNLTINFNLTGSTATSGTDYNALGTSIIIPAGASVTNRIITPVQDTASEGAETVVLNIADNAAYSVSNRTAIVTIADDDLPVVTIVATDADAREAGANPGVFTFSRTGSTAAALRVDYGVGGTASNSFDYATITNFIIIPAGQASATRTITPLADSSVEFLESVTLTVRGSDSYAIGSANSATVFIDDSNTPTYGWRRIRAAAVYTNWPSIIDSPAIIEIFRTGSALSAASFAFTVTTNGLTANPAHYQIAGDLSGSSVTFAANKTNALVYLKPSLNCPLLGNGVTFAIPSLFGGDGLPIYFQHSYRYLSAVEWVTPEAIENGQTMRLRATRLVAGPAISVPILFSGIALPQGYLFPDHNFGSSTTLTIPLNATFAELTVSAPSDSFAEGWESLVASVDVSLPDVSPAAPWERINFIRENITDLSLLTDCDTDGDGLPDRWEIQYGRDPLVFDDVTLDTDKDGLNLMDEFIFGTNPTNAATFGTNDFSYSRVTNTVDAVPIRFIVGDTGKHNNGMGCAQCHVTALQVGTVKFKSPVRTEILDRIANFEKGKSYPVRLIDLLAALPPATPGTATPQTTAKYTAQILPADTNAPMFILTNGNYLGTNVVWTNTAFTYTNALVIVPKLQLTWTNKSDNLPIETNTVPGTNTLMPGGGLRIFVGAKTPTDSVPRNTLMLKVKSIPALPNRTVYFKSFDVDDATDESFDMNTAGTGPVIDTNGRAGNDNLPDYLSTPQAGAFVTSGQVTNSVTLDASGEALVEFQVGMQPGNNYRIAATVFATNNLSSLQVTNATNAFFVEAGTNVVTNFNGDLSPMLTVWRKLHLEIDSMAAAPSSGSQANYDSGTIGYFAGNHPKVGQTTLRVDGVRESDRNQYENGTAVIDGVGTFSILGNHSRSLGMTTWKYFTVNGLPGTAGFQKKVTVSDDDDRFLSTVGLPSPQLPADGLHAQLVSGITKAFSRAYIQVVDANAMGWNTRTQVAFQRTVGLVPSLDGSPFRDSKDLFDRNQFWAHTVGLSHEYIQFEDADPNSEAPTLGITPKKIMGINPGGVSFVFLETIRDALAEPASWPGLPAGYPALRNNYYGLVYGVMAHEIGHYPGKQSANDDHGELGLMQNEAATIDVPFSAKSILRFRKPASWSN